MANPIQTQETYERIISQIEDLLHLATSNGGFSTLTDLQKPDLQHLTQLAEAWEDAIPIIPLRCNPSSA